MSLWHEFNKGIIKQNPSLVSQLKRPPVTLHDGHINQAFQAVHLQADRGLGTTQFPAGVAKTVLANDSNECSQQVSGQVHRRSYRMAWSPVSTFSISFAALGCREVR